MTRWSYTMFKIFADFLAQLLNKILEEYNPAEIQIFNYAEYPEMKLNNQYE